MRFINQIAILLLFCIPLAANAAGERHALVIGNATYGSGSMDLKNPINDAHDMAEQLTKMGYQVFGGGPALDLDASRFEKILERFVRDLPIDAHVIFYYAGHGMADKEDNYLIPVRNQIKMESQLRKRAVSVLRDVIAPLTQKNSGGVNVVLLDACRNNPLGNKSRGIKGGFRDITQFQRGVFVGYAAESGKVADDGNGRNGIYTEELLGVLRDSSHKIIEVAHKEVADRVFYKTNGEQFPVSKNKVYGNWCFGRCDELYMPAAPDDLSLSKMPSSLATPKESIVAKPDNYMFIIGGIALVALALVAGGGEPKSVSTGNIGSHVVLTPP